MIPGVNNQTCTECGTFTRTSWCLQNIGVI